MLSVHFSGAWMNVVEWCPLERVSLIYCPKIHFDGWSHLYDEWMDSDHPDVHPAGWCEGTGHPLKPPPCQPITQKPGEIPPDQSLSSSIWLVCAHVPNTLSIQSNMCLLGPRETLTARQPNFSLSYKSLPQPRNPSKYSFHHRSFLHEPLQCKILKLCSLCFVFWFKE